MPERGASPPLPSPVGHSVSLRTLALPLEHGSWGLALEPLALGLFAVPSWPGLGLALGAFLAFLSKRPLEVVAKSAARGERSSRALAAWALGSLYALGAAAVWAWVGLERGGGPFLLLLAAVPFAAVYVVEDARRRARSLVAELSAPLAFAAVPAAMALAADAAPRLAGALALAMVSRSLPTILYLRSRLRLARGESGKPLLAPGAHLAALGAMASLALLGILGPLSQVPYVLLLGRALLGLSGWRGARAARDLGWWEIAYGALTVAMVALAVPR